MTLSHVTAWVMSIVAGVFVLLAYGYFSFLGESLEKINSTVSNVNTTVAVMAKEITQLAYQSSVDSARMQLQIDRLDSKAEKLTERMVALENQRAGAFIGESGDIKRSK